MVVQEKVREETVKWIWERPLTFDQFVEMFGKEDLVELIDGVVVEREMAGERTRQALAVRRAQGVRLGRPRVVPDDVVRVIIARHKSGRSLRAIAAELNDDGIPTARGGGRWHPATVRAILVSRDVTHRATPRVA